MTGQGQAALALAAAVALVGANAFFVAVEFALVASRAARLEADADGGDRRSAKALAAMRDLQPCLAGAQLGITMASLGLGFVAEPAIAALIEPLITQIADISSSVAHSISFAVALAIVVPVHVVAGEMVAKNIAISRPERTAQRLAGLMQAYVTVFRPVIWSLNAISNSIVRLVGVKPVDEINAALTVKEFHTLLAGARDEGVIEPSEHELLSGALAFRDRSVGSLMVAVSETVMVQRYTTAAEVEKVVADSGHTRIPICGSTPDDMLGFVHAKDLLHIPEEARAEPLPIELIRRMLVVGPDVPALELMRRMCGLRVHIAVVKVGVPAGGAALEGVAGCIVAGAPRPTVDGDIRAVGGVQLERDADAVALQETAPSESASSGGAGVGTASSESVPVCDLPVVGDATVGSPMGLSVSGADAGGSTPADSSRGVNGYPSGIPPAVHRPKVGMARMTLGIITLEDVLESLVGEIYDETDDDTASLDLSR